MNYRYWLLIAVAPLLIMGSYWVLVDFRMPWMDWAALSASLLVGLAGIWSAPWRKQTQVVGSFAYVPAMGLTLAATLLFLECSTGNCL